MRTGNLNAALCRGLYPHTWAPKPTPHGVGVKGDEVFLTSDCGRCGSSRYERISLSDGSIQARSYAQSRAYRLDVAPGEARPTKAALRKEAIEALVASRRSRAKARPTSVERVATG